MKKSEVLKGISEAKLFGFFGEYRGGKIEKMSWVDKKNGKRMDGNAVRHNVETGINGEPVGLSEFAEDTVDVAKWQPPFKRGQMVFVNVTSFSIEKGAKSCRGTMIAIED